MVNLTVIKNDFINTFAYVELVYLPSYMHTKIEACCILDINFSCPIGKPLEKACCLHSCKEFQFSSELSTICTVL